MPQAAIAALGSFVAAAITTSGLSFIAQVFLYAASTYLLNRAAASLTPKRRSPGLGSGIAENIYLPGDIKIIEGIYAH